MIPLRLELRNFMSYGEDVPVLDLSGMHTVCLSGENGNGKSALLDAMTWALWGESRAGKNKHDDLVRIGSDEMSVQFTFEMDSQVYRVLRKRSKRASGNQWELQQQTPDQGLGAGWRSLTGNNAGETEKAIQKLLRMSYDTFLNSAYLRQGHADQFVRQTPGKRKEILADILDLSRYDQLEAKARDREREARAEATDLEREINSIDAELLGENGHRQELQLLHTQLLDLQAQQETLRHEWDALRARKVQLEGQKQFTDALKTQKAEAQKELGELALELADQKTETDGLRALLAREQEICRDYDALLETRRRLEELEESVGRWHKGQQMLAAAEREWLTAENEVRAKADRAAHDHDQALQQVKDYAFTKENRDALLPRVAASQLWEAELQETRARREPLETRFLSLREESAGLDAEIRQWQERLDALGRQQGVCQVCNAPLPESKVATVRADYEAGLAERQSSRKQVRAEAARLKEEIAAFQKREQGLEAQIKAGRQDQINLGNWEQQLVRLDAIQKTIPNLNGLRQETAQVVQEQAFAPEVRARVEKYRTALAKLEGVEAEQAAAKARLTLLLPAERQHLELQHAQKTLQDAESRLTRTQKTQAQRQDSLAAIERQLADLPDVGTELAQIEGRSRQIREQEAVRKHEESRALQDIGIREETLRRLAGLRLARVEKEKHLAGAKREQEVHDQLAKAFGKKGVQALIIENAIPELQEEANRLLERLTDGDMSLYFETVREAKTKKDAPIETLDIKVSDSLGTRPMEMYSGGEGFRASFAIRIALSKLLAHRAGARLQTLIIDEGFGTQDGKGREKLVDALNAIGDDFQKIIVITHIDELKDSFASRIEVVKTPSGSQITVMEGVSG